MRVRLIAVSVVLAAGTAAAAHVSAPRRDRPVPACKPVAIEQACAGTACPVLSDAVNRAYWCSGAAHPGVTEVEVYPACEGRRVVRATGPALAETYWFDAKSGKVVAVRAMRGDAATCGGVEPPTSPACADAEPARLVCGDAGDR